LYDPKEYGKIYRELNKERIAAKKREWRLNNPDKVKEHERRAALKRKKPPKPPLTEEEMVKIALEKKQMGARYYQANKHWLQENRTKYYREHKAAQMIRNLKVRIKRKNLPCDLEVTDIIIPDYCPVLGIKLNFDKKTKGPYPDSPSIDRIFPELGYVKGNIRVISNRANTLKNNMSLAEAELILKDLRKIHGVG